MRPSGAALSAPLDSSMWLRQKTHSISIFPVYPDFIFITRRSVASLIRCTNEIHGNNSATRYSAVCFHCDGAVIRPSVCVYGLFFSLCSRTMKSQRLCSRLMKGPRHSC